MLASKQKTKTCRYWANGNRCVNTAEQCRFAHFETGNTVKVPERMAATSQESTSDDLISLMSIEDRLANQEQSNERAKARPGQPESGDIVIAKAVHVAISRGESTVAINNILKSEPPALVKRSLEVSKHGAAALFTAVRGDRIDILRALIVHGVDPNTRHTSGMPILAAAIFQSNASAVVSVSILLELGADPFVIPRDLWDDSADSQDVYPSEEDLAKTRWCDEANRNLLNKCFNISIKHRLLQASREEPCSNGIPKTEDLIHAELSNHLLIAQDASIARVNEILRCHLLCGKKEPLVMVFIGPAGHGKTEMARRIGNVRRLLPYSASAQESSIPEKTQNIDVICIDEDDKVDPKLLVTILDGDSHGHCATVVILTITEKTSYKDYYFHLKGCLDNDWDETLWESFEGPLREDFISRYGPSLAGRISCAIPFVPFNDAETTVLAHKFILDAAEALTKSCLPIIPGPNKAGSQNNINFTVDADEAVCQFIGLASYKVDLGARSIEQAVFRKVKLKMAEECAKVYPSMMLSAGRRRVTLHRPLHFVVRLEKDRSISVVLQ